MSDFFPRHRLKALSAAVAIITGVLVCRLVIIQVIRHESYVAKAKQQWYAKVRIPARRGNIFDRNGYPLAVTNWTFDVGVTPRHFPKNDKKAVAYLAEVCGLAKKELRRRLARDCSYIRLGRDLHLTEGQVSELSSLSGVTLDLKHDRLYPFESMPPQLVGGINGAGSGMAGAELAFQDALDGEDGWFLRYQLAGDRKGYEPVNAPGRKPRNGNDLYLTIDTRIQSIVDFELAQALDRYGAISGMAIVIEPSTGDILALSEKPTRPLSRGALHADAFALRSINCIFEPGSTFKLITDSYLIESGKVDPYDAFFGENGKAAFGDAGVFHDDHKYGWLTFKESFVFSSNICTIKATGGVRKEDLYRHILSYGFGSRTGVDFPAESRGTLHNPGSWSARSLPSIAIGHEIGVTALQMAMAYGALANGGTLLVPRIALETRDGTGDVVERFSPVAVRRVFSEPTAATMQDFCAEVVLKGTGTKAAVEGIPVAGKTGTSQKAVGGRYGEEKYIASFIGFAPAQDPRLVCLVVLDEPGYPYWWGGESSAIVFSKIIEGINLSTDLLYDAGAGTVIAGGARSGGKHMPSFLRLTTDEAIGLADEHGLTVRCPKVKGIVYSQSPDPGTRIDRSTEVTLMVREPVPPEGTQSVPDVEGLSIREARRLLLACGLDCVVRGYGVVDRQDPSAGGRIPQSGAVILHCSPRTGDGDITGVPVARGADH